MLALNPNGSQSNDGSSSCVIEGYCPRGVWLCPIPIGAICGTGAIDVTVAVEVVGDTAIRCDSAAKVVGYGPGPGVSASGSSIISA